MMYNPKLPVVCCKLPYTYKITRSNILHIKINYIDEVADLSLVKINYDSSWVSSLSHILEYSNVFQHEHEARQSRTIVAEIYGSFCIISSSLGNAKAWTI